MVGGNGEYGGNPQRGGGYSNVTLQTPPCPSWYLMTERETTTAPPCCCIDTVLPYLPSSWRSCQSSFPRRHYIPAALLALLFKTSVLMSGILSCIPRLTFSCQSQAVAGSPLLFLGAASLTTLIALFIGFSC